MKLSMISKSAALAVSKRGLSILLRDKYSSHIRKTFLITFVNGIDGKNGKVFYEDEFGCLVLETNFFKGVVEFEPLVIGELIELSMTLDDINVWKYDKYELGA